jgi:hypothetical protein
MLNNAKMVGLLAVAAALVAGCSESQNPTAPRGAATAPDPAFLLPEKPADVRGVAQARNDSQSDEEIAVEGRIGGSTNPFVEGLAAFTLIDTKLQWCADDEGCPTPWDYCCSDKTGQLALVQVVGPDAQTVSIDARELLGVKELSKVVVRGRAQRDDQGNLTVLADKVHVVKD